MEGLVSDAVIYSRLGERGSVWGGLKRWKIMSPRVAVAMSYWWANSQGSV